MRVILPQIAQMTQRNAAGCIISQRKTDWIDGEVHSVIVVICGFVVYLRKSTESPRDIMGFLVPIV